MRELWGHLLGGVLLAGLVAGVCAGTVLATNASSPNYQISEPEFGAGSSLESCSGEYCAQATIGDISGQSGSNGKTTATFDTLEDATDPVLEVIIEDGESYLGQLTTDKTSYKTVSIKIRSYESDGYILQVMGSPPRYGSHSLAALSSPTSSEPGKEQFGINLVANTTPATGADPVQRPSSEMSHGVVEEDYATANKFMYQDGAVIARSDSATGQTDYTITMIINVANSTPAGHYATDFSAVITPAF